MVVCQGSHGCLSFRFKKVRDRVPPESDRRGATALRLNDFLLYIFSSVKSNAVSVLPAFGNIYFPFGSIPKNFLFLIFLLILAGRLCYT